MKKTAILFSGTQGPTPKKWSKNFDERPHRLRTCQVVLIELTFYAKLDRNCGRVHSDALCPRGQVGCQCRCGVCCSHSLMRFNNGSNPPNCPFPSGILASHRIHGFLGPPESTTQTGSRAVQPFMQNSLVCPTNTLVCSKRPHLCAPCMRCGLRYCLVYFLTRFSAIKDNQTLAQN